MPQNQQQCILTLCEKKGVAVVEQAGRCRVFSLEHLAALATSKTPCGTGVRLTP